MYVFVRHCVPILQCMDPVFPYHYADSSVYGYNVFLSPKTAHSPPPTTSVHLKPFYKQILFLLLFYMHCFVFMCVSWLRVCSAHGGHGGSSTELELQMVERCLWVLGIKLSAREAIALNLSVISLSLYLEPLSSFALVNYYLLLIGYSALELPPPSIKLCLGTHYPTSFNPSSLQPFLSSRIIIPLLSAVRPTFLVSMCGSSLLFCVVYFVILSSSCVHPQVAEFQCYSRTNSFAHAHKHRHFLFLFSVHHRLGRWSYIWVAVLAPRSACWMLLVLSFQ